MADYQTNSPPTSQISPLADQESSHLGAGNKEQFTTQQHKSVNIFFRSTTIYTNSCTLIIAFSVLALKLCEDIQPEKRSTPASSNPQGLACN